MRTIHEAPRETAVLAETDVLVCGGGVAGVSAAYCAARRGARVLLLERYAFLGGLVTQSLVITTPPLDNGIGLEVAERLCRSDAYSLVRNQSTDYQELSFHAMEPEVLKYELGRMLLEQGVECLLHTVIVDSIVEDGAIKGVIVESKAGRHAILAKVVVDATGDADVCARAGAPCAVPSKLPPATLMFNMIGVDTTRVLAEIGNWSKLRDVVQRARKQDDLEFDLEMTMDRGAPGVFGQDLVHEGEVNVWSGNLQGVDGLDPAAHSRAEFTCREHVMRLSRFLVEHVPGFEQSRVEYTATLTGVRGTRLAQGDIAPSMKDMLDNVYPDTASKPYMHTPLRVPYRSLVPRGVENLLVAGRCLSADPEGVGMLRLIPPCFATGHSAGVAAALSLSSERSPRALDINALQRAMIADGMDLGL
ncbi:MAG: FAD-dependent oxidoreductase [Dehalococcoidia bacterium]|nr:FAD-dependent oxidoreductase [Dehalococcoidia bacterium]